jgi:electron transfer flavoprotein alpha subunit
MKVLVFFLSHNGVVKNIEKISNNILTASFNSCSNCANFYPSFDIKNAVEGYEFVDKVVNIVHPDFVVFSDETLVRETASYYAGKKELGLISHSTRIYIKEGKLIGTVPGWENLEAEVYSLSTPPLMILKSNEQVSLKNDETAQKVEISHANSIIFVSREAKIENPLKNARVVFGIGRGVKKTLLPRIKTLAQRLGAEIGCTRPVADMGILPLNSVIGDSGISINPEIYVAFGISGALQHLSGVNAKYIIAINSDPNAPIFAKSMLPINMKVEDALPEIEKWIKNI